jgi:hypothetical protein
VRERNRHGRVLRSTRRAYHREIEAQLPSWDKEKLVLVQNYLEQKRAKAQWDEVARAATDAASAAAEAARRANNKASVAIILAVGAMMAAVLSAAVAPLSLHLPQN